MLYYRSTEFSDRIIRLEILDVDDNGEFFCVILWFAQAVEVRKLVEKKCLQISEMGVGVLKPLSFFPEPGTAGCACAPK